MLIKQLDEARRVLAVRDVKDEDDIRLADIAHDARPFNSVERQAEVIRRHAETERVTAFDVTLGLSERREQTRPDIQDCNLESPRHIVTFKAAARLVGWVIYCSR